MKPGMIGFSNNRVGLLPKLIRYFTHKEGYQDLSHTFVITGSVFNEVSLQEANELISVMPFNKSYRDNTHMQYWLYEVVASDEAKKEALSKVYVEFAGTIYGFFQNIWFVYRWLAEKFGCDVKKQKNWMTDGVICSELVYWYLYYLGPEFQALLKDFNPDTIMPIDLLVIVKANPNLFIFECSDERLGNAP